MNHESCTFAAVKDTSTICAISTAPGVGGIAVIRLSGPKAFDIANSICDIDVSNLNANSSVFTRVLKDEVLVDETMLSKYVKPKSFTGEDVIEIACHGSSFIQSTLIDMLLDAGCELAGPGEFTMRAYLNGKMDLSQAEAVADLIASESASAHKMAMHQMRGGFSKDLQELRDKLIHFASLIELELDFSEEDVEFADREDLKDHVDTVINYVRRLLESFSVGNVLKNGIPVAIVGRPNAGKSTLLNALLNDERAIVSDIAGTTRDTIEERFVMGGYTFRLIDTAGIRQSEDTIEKIGIERTFKSIREASIVLYLYDVVTTSLEEVTKDLEEISDDKHVVVIANKTDLSSDSSADRNHISLSAKHKSGLDELTKALKVACDDIVGSQNNTIVSNMRHVEALKLALKDLEQVRTGLDNNITGDFLAMDIRSSLNHLGSITGTVTTDDLLSNIFSRFCIGK